MASEWNLWVWLECIGVVGGYCCKEVYLDILIIYIIITSPYSTCISTFLGSSVPISLFIFKNQAPPAKTMLRSIIVQTSLSLRILHSLEHSHFMGGFLAEYLGISSDVHHSFL